MSYYDVKLDGISIYDPAEMPLTFIAPKVVGGLSDAGSFDFTMPKLHVFYNNIVPYGSTIEVFEDGQSIFYGRPTLPKVDFYGNKQVHCEGALSFLNDVILPPVKVSEGAKITMTQYIQEVFNYYNKTCRRNDRKLTLGTISLRSNQSANHSWNYETCFYELKNGILPYTGSYTIIRRSGNTTYVDFAYRFLNQINQPIKLSSNLLDLENTDQDFYTAVIAKGATDEVQMLAPMMASTSLIQKYGFICAYKDYPDCETMEALQSKCNSFLQNQQVRGKRFSITATDLHLGNSAVEQFSVGKVAKIDSSFHNDVDDMKAVISRIEISLDTGEKNTTLLTLTSDGRIFGDPKPLSIVDELKEEKKPKEPKPGEYPDKNPIKGDDGNSYIVHIDENGVVTPTKIPDDLNISNPTNYNIGDTFDPSDVTSTFKFGDGTEVPAEDIEYNIPDGYEFNGETDPDWLTATYTDPNTGITYTETIPINKETQSDIVCESIAFTRKPEGVTLIGDVFNIDDYTVTATRTDGSTVDVTSMCQFNLVNGYVFDNNRPEKVSAMFKCPNNGQWYTVDEQIDYYPPSDPVNINGVEFSDFLPISRLVYMSSITFPDRSGPIVDITTASGVSVGKTIYTCDSDTDNGYVLGIPLSHNVGNAALIVYISNNNEKLVSMTISGGSEEKARITYKGETKEVYVSTLRYTSNTKCYYSIISACGLLS